MLPYVDSVAPASPPPGPAARTGVETLRSPQTAVMASTLYEWLRQRTVMSPRGAQRGWEELSAEILDDHRTQ